MHFLRTHIRAGRVLTECPISTADGIKAADVAWASPDRMKNLGKQVCFLRAPEICVEVISPGNSDTEMAEKMALYFDAGALEVWFCAEDGTMSFHSSKGARRLRKSTLCPGFPRQVELR